MKSDLNTNLVWMDLEMTGLEPDQDTILEIATIITDQELNVLAEGPTLIIHHSLQALEAMDEWNRTHHSKSGLWDRALNSKVTLEQAEQETLEFLKKWVHEGKSPLCGNSIGQDRRFLYKYMPILSEHLHYRNVDVSTLKELAKRWYPELPLHQKAGSHRALDDIKESIAELKYYRKEILK